ATLPAAGTSVAVGPLGQAYLEFTHDCTTASLQVHVEGSGPYAARAVEVRGGGRSTSRRADSTGGGVDGDFPDWNNAARAVLILVNRDAQPQRFTYQATAAGPYQAVTDLAATQQVTIVDESGAAPAGPLPLESGQTRQLRALAFFGSCADGLDATDAAAWSAGDEGVARVSAGLVTAQGAGQTEIGATVGEATATRVPVTVTAGCSCRVGGSGARRATAAADVVVLLAGGWRRRRRRSDCRLAGRGALR
ncbi:MAG: hypothetical protein HY906_16080, partial [Deltaproteobacteria bacterium]|nr:hypothetical protein [Deltaproteobacteria bacterium]